MKKAIIEVWPKSLFLNGAGAGLEQMTVGLDSTRAKQFKSRVSCPDSLELQILFALLHCF